MSNINPESPCYLCGTQRCPGQGNCITYKKHYDIPLTEDEANLERLYDIILGDEVKQPPKSLNKKDIHLVNADCLTYLKTLSSNSIDLVMTSPPYNCGIEYSTYNDSRPYQEYLDWCQEWINECYRVCKDDGRIAINVPVEMGTVNNSVRVSPMTEFVKMIGKAGFHLMGIPMWFDTHRVKYTAWGSWMSASAPYIYNPNEVVVLGYKKYHKKQYDGESTISKQDFIDGCSGIWDIMPETRGLTKANFPVELPEMAINLLTYKGDTVLDPFSGSGTTGIACLNTGRKYIGIEIDTLYHKIAQNRINGYSIQNMLF